MKCPVCTNAELEFKDIDIGLGAGVCSKCDGRWISLQSYETWREFGNKVSKVKNSANERAGTTEFEKARICPKCDRLLTKYRIQAESPLMIDRCSNCAGVWLGSIHWSTLKTLNLDMALREIFTDHWQNSIVREETRQNLARIYQEKFGLEGFEKVREFKQWVFDQDNCEELLSYVRDSNPLQL